jgi:hypothetical protein
MVSTGLTGSIATGSEIGTTGLSMTAGSATLVSTLALGVLFVGAFLGALT